MEFAENITWKTAYVIITLVTCAGLTTPCPGVTHGDRCIYFPEPNVYRTWADSQRMCDALGGQLATPTSEADDTVLNTLIRQTSINTFWLGGQQTGLLWTWVVNGLELQGQGCYADDPSDPDRLATSRSFGTLTPAMCMTLCDDQGYAYAAVQGGDLCWCTSAFRFVDHKADCTIPCSGDSQVNCGGPGNNFVYKIGGAFGVWALGQPNNHNGNQKCGAMDNYMGRKLSDEACSKQLMYFCTVGTANCDGRTDFHLFGAVCYHLGRDPLDWYSARDACVDMSGDLTYIENEAVQSALTTIMDTAVANISVDTKIWVGLSRTLWRWLSGDEIAYTNWAPGEPDVGNQGCVLLSQDDNYQWLDVDCGDFNQFVCDLPLSLVTTTALTTTATPSTTVTSPPSSAPASSPYEPSSVTSIPTSEASDSSTNPINSTPSTTTAIPNNTNTLRQTTHAVDDVTTSSAGVTTTRADGVTAVGDVTTSRQDASTTTAEVVTRTSVTSSGSALSSPGPTSTNGPGGPTSTDAPGGFTTPGGPNAGASTTSEESGGLRLVLFVLLGVILLFALVIGIIIAAGYLNMKRRRNRVADMRHLASVPNFDTPSIYSTMKEADSYVAGPRRDFPYEEFR